VRSITSLVGVTGFLAAFCAPARADQPDLSAGQLKSQATHVVSGTVKRVYASEKEKGVTRYVIEIAVERCSKGEGPKAGEVLYVRCWKRNENSKDADSKDGQSRIPSAREPVDVYLKRALDGGFDTLELNAIHRQRSGD
jgi:hypothetical protein